MAVIGHLHRTVDANDDFEALLRAVFGGGADVEFLAGFEIAFDPFDLECLGAGQSKALDALSARNSSGRTPMPMRLLR